MDEYAYTFTGIRAVLEEWWTLRQAAVWSEGARVVYVDLTRAMGDLPLGLRQRMWDVLVMDMQHKMSAVYVQDLVKGPIRRMMRFLNGRAAKGDTFRRSV